MKRLFLLILILTLSLISVRAQSSELEKPFLRNRYVKNGNSVQSMSEYGFYLAKILHDNPNSLLIIRICSAEFTPIAANISSINPVLLAKFMLTKKTMPKFSVRQIFVETTSTCIEPNSSTAATEFWIAPKSYLERSNSINICRLRVTDYKSKKDEKLDLAFGTVDYIKSFNELVHDIRIGLHDSGVVIAYHEGPQTKLQRRRYNKLIKIAKRLKLYETKIKFRTLDWNGDDSIGRINQLAISSIKIEDSCIDQSN